MPELNAYIDRSVRFAEEPSLGGIESLGTTVGQRVNAIIPAATADVLAACTIQRDQVTMIALRSDYPVTVRFVGSRSVTVTASNLVGYGTSNFVIDEPLPDWLGVGDVIGLVDCDMDYDVFYTIYNLAVDRLAVYPHGTILGGATAGEIGAIVPVTNRIFPITTSTAGPQTFTLTGQFDGVVGDIARIFQRNVGTLDNNGLFGITGAVYDAVTDTTLVTTYNWGITPSANAGGFLRAMSFEKRINLAAGVPFIWSIESGLECPLICDVSELRVTNAGVNAADLQGRIVTAVP